MNKKVNMTSLQKNELQNEEIYIIRPSWWNLWVSFWLRGIGVGIVAFVFTMPFNSANASDIYLLQVFSAIYLTLFGLCMLDVFLFILKAQLVINLTKKEVLFKSYFSESVLKEIVSIDFERLPFLYNSLRVKCKFSNAGVQYVKNISTARKVVHAFYNS